MASVPGVIGGQIAGVIRTRVKIEPKDAFRIKLSCVNCITTSGPKQSIIRNIIWQDDQLIAHELLQHDANHSAIPVLFPIPYECRQTDDSDPNSIIFWSLEVTAKTRGLDFQATFEVPVFKTPQSDPHFVVDRTLIAKYAAPEDPARDLHDAGVRRTSSPTGDGRRFVFPMARQPGAATLLTAFSLTFFGVPVFLFFSHAGLIAIPFGIVFPLCALITTIFAIDLWFYRSVVDVSHSGLTITGGLFGRGPSQWIEASDVAKIQTVSHMGNDKLEFYDLVVVCSNGKRVTAGKRVPGKRLATSISRQIEQAMGKLETPVGG
jgi:hypothetical protein